MNQHKSADANHSVKLFAIVVGLFLGLSLMVIGLFSFAQGNSFAGDRTIQPVAKPKPLSKITLTKPSVVKTISVGSGAVDMDKALSKRTNAYLNRITNLKDYTVKTTVVDNWTWLITFNKREVQH